MPDTAEMLVYFYPPVPKLKRYVGKYGLVLLSSCSNLRMYLQIIEGYGAALTPLSLPSQDRYDHLTFKIVSKFTRNAIEYAILRSKNCLVFLKKEMLRAMEGP